MLDDLVEVLSARCPDRVLRVAVDGPDAAGKTTLADALAARLTGRRPTIRVSIDDFHHPREVRQRQGPLSAEGHYRDSFDYAAVRRQLLLPLAPGGDRWYREAALDYRTDTPVAAPPRQAPATAVLLCDGVFLQRPELREHWDFRIYVDITPAETVRRALVRDAGLFGDTVRERYQHRYLPAQQLYRERCHPVAHADVVIDNNDPHRPVLRWGPEGEVAAGEGRVRSVIDLPQTYEVPVVRADFHDDTGWDQLKAQITSPTVEDSRPQSTS